ncbi:MAG TPA: DUF4271 domain-containing protein [Cyclobacteriaceae bacterium]|nr:DUF4271 domain-containing protein [Cyclobacteriaceae bacterium]
MKGSALLIIVFLVTGFAAKSQDQFTLKKDLRESWQIFSDDSYSTFNEDEIVHTIYFSVNANKYKGDYLILSGENPFSVFLNGKLIADQHSDLALSIDSLNSLVSTSALFLGVHQKQKIDSSALATSIQTKAIVSAEQEVENYPFRKGAFFRDFVITSVLILVIFLTSTIRLNPRLSSDYFSVTKIFSLRDNDDDDQLYNRLTSGNILFYFFTSLILGFFVIVIGQFTDIGLPALQVNGYLDGWLTWLRVSVVIFGFLFLKMIIIYLMASLFGIRDISGFHFFNFTRLLLISIGTIALVIAVYYILHGQQKGFYFFLYQFARWILFGWIILFFFKLTNRAQRSVFHLFSYICATEIIPFLLIVKVLNE